MRAVADAGGLAARLREGTRQVHARAERTGIMRRLLRGELTLERYRALLRNLYDIYAALERALLQHADHPVVGPVVIPALFRSAALTADLDQLATPNWRETISAEAATGRYVARLASLACDDAGLLVAHAYVRYLGDLNGGQILKRIVAPMLPPESGGAVRFYEFGSREDVMGFVARFSSGLSVAPVDEDTIERLVLEAYAAFELHCELFEALDTSAGS